jgi:hypothetical protein
VVAEDEKKRKKRKLKESRKQKKYTKEKHGATCFGGWSKAAMNDFNTALVIRVRDDQKQKKDQGFERLYYKFARRAGETFGEWIGNGTSLEEAKKKKKNNGNELEQVKDERDLQDCDIGACDFYSSNILM